MSGFLAAPRVPGFWLSLKLALRELRGGLGGFRVFLACLALGVASIAGVGSVSRGLTDGLRQEGRAILGADLVFSQQHTDATPDKRAYLAGLGRLTDVVTLRAMARSEAGEATLSEIKAVDPSVYPLVGRLGLEPAGDLAPALGAREGQAGAVADPALLARLGIDVGDEILLGEVRVRVAAALVDEPDALSEGIDFGPRLIVALDTLQASGLLQPTSIARWSYRLALPDGTPDEALPPIVEEAEAAFPDAGWRVRGRDNASERLSENIQRFTQFITIVGLTALLVGGVGVANGVTAFVDRKRESIAVMKSLGATGTRIFSIYLSQIMLIAGCGIAIGLAVGALTPFIVEWGFGAILPLPFLASLQPAELLLAALYGFLVALTFGVWPLARAHDIPVSALFRDHVAERSGWPRRRYVVFTVLATAGLVALAITSAYDVRVGLFFVAAAGAVFLLLRLVAIGIMAAARRLPPIRSTELRLAIANIHRPGALTASIVLSLGLGLSLLVTLVLIDGSIRHQLTAALPERAPSFFFVDIPNSEAQAFSDLVLKESPGATLETVPMLRGRIIALNGQSTENYEAGEAAWVLRGDRGITHSATVPENSRVVEGEWWPADYSGENLVSLEKRIADELRVGIGDTLTVNVLGRDITARIGNLRDLEWESLGINFVMVFSPNTFAGAPYQVLATLSYAEEAPPAREFALLRDVAAAFPGVVSVRVKDALNTIDGIVANLALAIRSASAVTLIASVLVLAGALAAGHRYRVYDAVILKTLGATRRRVLSAYALEYMIVGGATALFGLVAGSISAYIIITWVMRITFVPDIPGALVAAFAALAFTVALGLYGTWRLLGRKPAAVLREL